MGPKLRITRLRCDLCYSYKKKCTFLINLRSFFLSTDFGFATRFPTNKQKLLETFCSSYAYAAPEILQAEKYDGKIADIWSL